MGYYQYHNHGLVNEYLLCFNGFFHIKKHMQDYEALLSGNQRWQWNTPTFIWLVVYLPL